MIKKGKTFEKKISFLKEQKTRKEQESQKTIEEYIENVIYRLEYTDLEECNALDGYNYSMFIRCDTTFVDKSQRKILPITMPKSLEEWFKDSLKKRLEKLGYGVKAIIITPQTPYPNYIYRIEIYM